MEGAAAPNTMRHYGGFRIRGLAVIFLLLCLQINPVYATSVARITFDEVCDRAELIVEGRVIQVYARMADDGRAIWTHVVIEVLEPLKGTPESQTLELKFMGGTVDGMTMQVGEMHAPQVGEHGVYFVESTRVQQVHPLVGWDQGRYVVERTPAGLERMVSFDGRVIDAVRLGAVGDGRALSAGVPFGVDISDSPGPSAGVSISDFKSAVRQSTR